MHLPKDPLERIKEVAYGERSGEIEADSFINRHPILSGCIVLLIGVIFLLFGDHAIFKGFMLDLWGVIFLSISALLFFTWFLDLIWKKIRRENTSVADEAMSILKPALDKKTVYGDYSESKIFMTNLLAEHLQVPDLDAQELADQLEKANKIWYLPTGYWTVTQNVLLEIKKDQLFR